MKDQFEAFLVQKGYKTTTPSSLPSTVYSYIKCIDKVCEWENLNWHTLAGKIEHIVTMYDFGGIKENLGCKSHRTVINALKQYAEFVNQA